EPCRRHCGQGDLTLAQPYLAPMVPMIWSRADAMTAFRTIVRIGLGGALAFGGVALALAQPNPMTPPVPVGRTAAPAAITQSVPGVQVTTPPKEPPKEW